MMKIKSIFSWIKTNVYLLLVMTLSTILRLVNLGYSNYQGDEIKALYIPLDENTTFFKFILDQRKGPLQFITTYLIKLIDHGYVNQFFDRLPFALAGILAIFFFYKFVELHFGKKIAFYASLFFGASGFFVAFSRIIQYQSFVIMFMIAALYFLSLAVKDKKYYIKGLYIGLICWAMSLLSHYDGIFILPFIVYLLILWFKNKEVPTITKIKHFIIVGLISGALLASFYVPFVLNISRATKDYWLGRISGDVSGKISSSKYLFSVYQPIYVIHIYLILAFLGLIFIILGLTSKYILKIKKLPEIIKKFFTHSTEHMDTIQKFPGKVYALFAWFLLPFIFFEVYVSVPGTHIYCYIVPAFIFLAYGLVTLESLTFKIFEYRVMWIINIIGLTLLFTFIYLQSYTIFVDNYKEYPWETKKFLVWTFPPTNPTYHTSLFGFPYYRDWQGIREFVLAFHDIEAYTSNERGPITRYYIPLYRIKEQAGFFIYVNNPQSFEENIVYDKAAYWVSKYEPVHTLTKNGVDLVRIYIMKTGTLNHIKGLGY